MEFGAFTVAFLSPCLLHKLRSLSQLPWKRWSKWVLREYVIIFWESLQPACQCQCPAELSQPLQKRNSLEKPSLSPLVYHGSFPLKFPALSMDTSFSLWGSPCRSQISPQWKLWNCPASTSLRISLERVFKSSRVRHGQAQLGWNLNLMIWTSKMVPTVMVETTTCPAVG